MAEGLIDRLRKNRPLIRPRGFSSVLQEATQEDLQSLAAQSGLPSTPVTPVGAESIGAGPNQAKMAGTPAQVRSAVQLSIRPEQDYLTAQRRQQVRQVATEEEISNISRAQRIEGLGSLGERVETLTRNLLTQPATPTQTQLMINQSALSSLIPEGPDRDRAQELLTKLGQNNISNEELVELANKFNITEIKDLPTLKETLSNQFLTTAEQIGTVLSTTLPDTINISQLTSSDLESLGFSSLSDLASVLQVSETELSTMTLRDLQNLVGKEQLEDFSKVANAQRLLADINTPKPLREKALQELRELGGVGLRVAESQVKKIVDSVQEASTVKFGGKEVKIEDLLSDKYLKGLINSYFRDPEAQRILKEKEPEFAAWIDENNKVLSIISSNVSKRQQDFADIQIYNMKLKDTPAGAISETAMKAIYTDYGKLKASRYEPPAFLKRLKENKVPASAALDLINTINTIAEIDPIYVKDLAELTDEEYDALKLNSQEVINNYRNYVETLYNIDDVSDDRLLDVLTGGELSQEQLQALKTLDDSLISFGLNGSRELGESSELLKYVDNPTQLKEAYKNLVGVSSDTGKPLTLKELINSGRTANITSVNNIFKNISDSLHMQMIKDDLFSTYGKYWLNDNKLTAAEVDEIAATASIHDLTNLSKLYNKPNIDSDAKNKLMSVINNISNAQIDDMFRAGIAPGYANIKDINADIHRIESGNFVDTTKIIDMGKGFAYIYNSDIANKNPPIKRILEQKANDLMTSFAVGLYHSARIPGVNPALAFHRLGEFLDGLSNTPELFKVAMNNPPLKNMLNKISETKITYRVRMPMSDGAYMNLVHQPFKNLKNLIHQDASPTTLSSILRQMPTDIDYINPLKEVIKQHNL